MNDRKEYEHHYTDFTGKQWSGSTTHKSDQEAIDYYQSLQENGGIIMHSLRRNGFPREMWKWSALRL